MRRPGKIGYAACLQLLVMALFIVTVVSAQVDVIGDSLTNEWYSRPETTYEKFLPLALDVAIMLKRVRHKALHRLTDRCSCPPVHLKLQVVTAVTEGGTGIGHHQRAMLFTVTLVTANATQLSTGQDNGR